MTPDQRFWRKVAKSDGCWEWTGCKGHTGYGQFSTRKTTIAAHRFAYLTLVGPIPEGLVLDHLCRNRGCVNPAHLEPVTQGENVRRGARCVSDRCARGHLYDGTRNSTRPEWRRCRVCEALNRAAKKRALALVGGEPGEA